MCAGTCLIIKCFVELSNKTLSEVFFIFRLLQYIDDIIANHKDKLLLNSDEVFAGKPLSSFGTVCIDR